MHFALSSRSIHLCVDMQRLFSAEGPWPTPWMKQVLPSIERLAHHHPDRTVFTRFVTPERPEDVRGAWRIFYARWPETTRRRIDPALLELMPNLAALVPPAVVFDKPVYSAFGGHRLHDHLLARGTDALIISGAETDVCVLATVMGAVDHGYPVIVVKDGVCSSSDSGHESLLGMFEQRLSQQICVASADEVLASWPDD